MKKILFLFSLVFIGSNTIYSQCTGATPLFVVNLSSSPTATWTSPSVTRAGSCCSDNNCVAFLITLHPLATEISLTISSGAIPTGALFYQIGCGGLQSVGATACISGPGPHLVTFCKPGNNVNTYTITSNPVNASPDFSMMEGTSTGMFASGLTAGTITWNSIFPGALGTYNSYLSCTNCATPTITAPLGAPPLVRYVVSGNAVSGCLPLLRYDTVNVTILDPPLPIEMISFTGTYNTFTQAVDLSWSTATENNNHLFNCQRSEDCIQWSTIGTVNSYGNSNSIQNYQYTDSDPVEKGYYRLVQVDDNGNEKIFGPVFVNTANTEPLTWEIFPNPTTGDFIIQFNHPAKGEVHLIDQSGRRCYSTTITSSYQQIQVSGLPAGMYYVELEMGVEVYHSRIILQ